MPAFPLRTMPARRFLDGGAGKLERHRMKTMVQEIEGIWTSDKPVARKRRDTENLLQCLVGEPAAKDTADLAALREALQAALASLESFTAHIETCDLEDSDLQALCKARAALARSGKGEA